MILYALSPLYFHVSFNYQSTDFSFRQHCWKSETLVLETIVLGKKFMLIGMEVCEKLSSSGEGGLKIRLELYYIRDSILPKYYEKQKKHMQQLLTSEGP